MCRHGAQAAPRQVHAGAGGVGSFAIQLLKYWGATVITSCSHVHVDKVKALRADLAINYKAQRLEKLAGAANPLSPIPSCLSRLDS